MTPEERRKKRREVMRAFETLNQGNQEKLLRYATHLAEHSFVCRAYMGKDKPAPDCFLVHLN